MRVLKEVALLRFSFLYLIKEKRLWIGKAYAHRAITRKLKSTKS